MERLLELLPSRGQPRYICYGITTAIMAFCATVVLALQHLTNIAGLFLLLPGIFAAGFLVDRRLIAVRNAARHRCCRL